MPLYDATLPIRQGMLTFPGDPPFRMSPFFSRTQGDPFNLSLVSMGTHMGTHVDAPAHYLDGGATVDQIPLDVLIGPGVILDMTGRSFVDRRALEESNLDNHVRVLLKTDNGPKLSNSEFHTDFIQLTEDAAHLLVERKVLLVGIDYLSIEGYENPTAPVHRALLSSGVLVVEGLNLVQIPAGPCEIYCMPLKIAGADGAPARVLILA
jgi:arylformamidase